MSDQESFNSETYETNTTSVVSNINKTLLSSIALTLEKVIEENKSLNSYNKRIKDQSSMVFSSSVPPKISLFDYLYRIQLYSEVDDSTLIIALIYIDRLCEISTIMLTPHNIHRLLFGSILAAIKYNEDTFYEMKYYAEIAGVDVKELKMLESEFVNMIEFKLFVNKIQFEKYNNYLTHFNVKD